MNVYKQRGSNIFVGMPSGSIEELRVSNFSLPVNSTNKLVVYRPRFQRVGSVRLAGLFFNMEEIFPCINEDEDYRPTCGMLTREEDGFNPVRNFIQTGDGGNTLRVFSTTIRPYILS